jgi:excisionase family DNA binding protein
MRMKSLERSYTVREIVGATGLSERCVREMISDGRLASVRLSGVRAVRVPAAALRTLLGEPPAASTSSRGGSAGR